MRISKYEQQAVALEYSISGLKKRSKTFLIIKIFTFLLCAYLGWNYVTSKYLPLYGITCLVVLLLYILALFFDAKLQKKIHHLENRLSAVQNELKYLKGDFTSFEEGKEFIDASHPFSFDLDLFGIQGLFNRLNRTVSQVGKEKLAGYLSGLNLDREQILERQNSLKELSEQDDWRLEFLAYGKDASFDLKKLVEIQSSSTVKPVLHSKIVRLLFIIPPIATMGTLLLSIFDLCSSTVVGALFVLQLLFCFLLGKYLNNIAQEVGGIFKGFKSYRKLYSLILSQDFESKELQELQKKLRIDTKLDVLTSFNKLSSILSNLDQRANLIIYIVANGFYLRDYWLLQSYFTWRETSLKHLETWVDILAEFDALVSLSTMVYNQPERNFATIVKEDTPVFNAVGAYHPFIKCEQAVANDFNLPNSNFAIVTGANMAGKSTFLRCVGLNMILALNGMTVCAERMEVSVVKLFSSMRTTDDLVRNISYFNAELTRLGNLITYCKENKHTLIILDEILKGTNSKDKLNGSRLFLSEISKLAVTGIIATHDLALSELSDADSRFKNYCFEIELSDQIDYTYKMTEGVARNMNATHLLEQIINKIGSPK